MRMMGIFLFLFWSATERSRSRIWGRRWPQGLVVFWRTSPELQCPAAVRWKPRAWRECDSSESSCRGTGSVRRDPRLQSGSSFGGCAMLSARTATWTRVSLPICYSGRWFPECMQRAPEILHGSHPDPLPACVWIGGSCHPWQHEQGSPPFLPRPSDPHTFRWPFCSRCICPPANLPRLSQEIPVRKTNWISLWMHLK